MFTDGGPSLYYADPKTFKTRQVGHDPGRQGARSPASTSSNASTARSTATSSRPARSCASIRQTGCIDAVADLSVLWEVMTPDERASTNSGENVLNGIAYDAKTGLFYLTGKRWRAIFVGRFATSNGAVSPLVPAQAGDPERQHWRLNSGFPLARE